MSQIGSSPQVGMKIKNIWNHQLGPRFHQTGSWFTSFRDHHSLATQLITFTEIQQNLASTERPLPWFIHLPGTPHNHPLNGCLVISNHFLCKDLESSNWNNHKKTGSLEFQVEMLDFPRYLRLLECFFSTENWTKKMGLHLSIWSPPSSLWLDFPYALGPW